MRVSTRNVNWTKEITLSSVLYTELFFFFLLMCKLFADFSLLRGCHFIVYRVFWCSYVLFVIWPSWSSLFCRRSSGWCVHSIPSHWCNRFYSLLIFSLLFSTPKWPAINFVRHFHFSCFQYLLHCRGFWRGILNFGNIFSESSQPKRSSKTSNSCRKPKKKKLIDFNLTWKHVPLSSGIKIH